MIKVLNRDYYQELEEVEREFECQKVLGVLNYDGTQCKVYAVCTDEKDYSEYCTLVSTMRVAHNLFLGGHFNRKVILYAVNTRISR